MAIIINIDVMLAKRKMSVTELTEKVGITMANLSILKNGKWVATPFAGPLEAGVKKVDWDGTKRVGIQFQSPSDEDTGLMRRLLGYLRPYTGHAALALAAAAERHPSAPAGGATRQRTQGES